MSICRDFRRDPMSGGYSLIHSFTGHPVAAFPGTAEPFCVFCLLTDALGEADAELVVTCFGDTEVVEYVRSRGRIPFPDPLRLVEYVFQFNRLPLPEPGVYLFTLFVDGEWAAQKVLRVYLKGEMP